MTGSQRDAQNQFGRLAGSYATSKTHAGPGNLVDLGELLAQEDTRYGIAVDIGTGPGFTAFGIAPHCDQVIATDVTAQMLREVRRLRDERGAPHTQMALAAAEALPFADASIDLVTSRTASHHFVDLPGWLREVRRVLRPGGVLLAADTCAPEDPEAAAWMHEIELRRDASHVRNLPPSQWRAALEQAHLTLTYEAMSIVRLQFPDWAERAGMRPEALASLRDDLLDAPLGVRTAFGITETASGGIDFHWDVFTVRAEKR